MPRAHGTDVFMAIVPPGIDQSPVSAGAHLEGIGKAGVFYAVQHLFVADH